MEVSGVKQQLHFVGLRAARDAQLNVLSAVAAGLENVKAIQAAGAAPSAPTNSSTGKLLDIKV
jgi:hypothetical protein